MTICKFYANGYCRYGNSCRFQHIDGTNDYYKKTYNRSDGRQSQPTANTSNRVGFSFNRALESVSTNQNFGQQMSSNTNLNFRSKESQMFSSNRNVFQLENSSISTNQRVGAFSFNRTLQQISSNDRPPSRSAIDDIEMDSTAVPRMRVNSGSRESQPNTFGLFSQTNNLFGNKSLNAVKNESFVNTNPSINEKSSDDIYSKHLTQEHIKQFQSNTFTFKSIPVCPPTQTLCF